MMMMMMIMMRRIWGSHSDGHN